MEEIAQKQLTSVPQNLNELDQHQFPLLPYNILGIEKLRSLMDEKLREKEVEEKFSKTVDTSTILKGIDDLVDDLTSDQDHGLIMTMGKGGVGKTITASVLAIMIARKGFEVHLTTTDPAAHLQDFIDQVSDLPANFTIDRIDPKIEAQRYTEKVLRQKGDLGEDEKKLLLEDLKSPCTEEVAVFHAFSKAIQQAKRKFVVIDTAPTGHTLLLLDTAGSYHREIMRNTALDIGRIKTPYMVLQDSNLSKVILVSLPETTPMREASDLQEDLKRAGIHPYAWVVNQSLSMQPALKDPLLRSRARAEGEVIQTIENTLAQRLYGIPYLPKEALLPALLGFYRENQIENKH